MSDYENLPAERVPKLYLGDFAPDVEKLADNTTKVLGSIALLSFFEYGDNAMASAGAAAIGVYALGHTVANVMRKFST